MQTFYPAYKLFKPILFKYFSRTYAIQSCCFLLIFILFPITAIGQTDSNGYWEGSFHSGYAFLDKTSRPNTDNDAPVLALSMARFLSPRFSLAFEVERIFTEINDLPRGINNKFELNTASLAGRFYTRTHSGFSGFGLLAVGLTDHSGEISESSNLSLSLGTGIRYQWGERFSSRLQLVYRRDSDIIQDRRSADLILTTGLNYRFGPR